VARFCELGGGWVTGTRGETMDRAWGYPPYPRREPFGVVGVILPWNAPLNQAGRAVAPALAAGNTVVAKPSEFTSGSLLRLARLAVDECGLPPGVLNGVTGTGDEAGAGLGSPRGRREGAGGRARSGGRCAQAARSGGSRPRGSSR